MLLAQELGGSCQQPWGLLSPAPKGVLPGGSGPGPPLQGGVAPTPGWVPLPSWLPLTHTHTDLGQASGEFLISASGDPHRVRPKSP